FRDGTRVAATAPDLVRAMCESNASQLVPAADRVIELLSRARESLVTNNTVAELVEAGHAARTRYDNFPRSDIFHVVIGGENWREELAAGGRAGAVIRSALPTLDSRR
ncbi:prephenate dehydrogenase, partial [Mycobacterium nebraskense]